MKLIRRCLSVLVAACLLAGALPLLAAGTAAASYTSIPATDYYEKHANIGWEGDQEAAFTYIDGSFQIRDGEGGETYLTMGISSYGVPARWYNAEGYLPCLISEYAQQEFAVKVENFGDRVTIGGNDYVLIYTRLTVTNNAAEREIPLPSGEMIPLNEVTATMSAEGAVIGSGETVVREYAVVSDRFGAACAFPAGAAVAAQGGFDVHYEHMKTYWNDRVSALVQITSVPEDYRALMDEYKAGYIYQMITKDGQAMNVTEQWYNDIYNHDYINMLSSVVQLGDFRYFDEYAYWEFNYTNGGYSDGFYKAAFPFAYYLMKTGDTAMVEKYFDQITGFVRKIETSREDSGLLNPDGTRALVMQRSISIDKRGTWLLDSQSALGGLYAYKYLCDSLSEVTGEEKYRTEADWAAALYRELMTSVETVVGNTIRTYGLTYLPMSVYVPNELTNRGTCRDSNWLAIFLFGFWSWDGYLMGIEQEGNFLYEMIDDTYTYDLATRFNLNQSDGFYTPGAYGSCDYSSGYNAGYGTGGLRGELYRDWGIEAALWMINYAQNAPYAWWENVADPSHMTAAEAVSWEGPLAFSNKGTGDGPHTWGQSTMTQMVLAALIAEKTDGTVILGRGIPYSWISSGEVISLENYAYGKGNRMGYSLTAENELTVQLRIEASADVNCVLELPAFIRNIASATDGSGSALAFDLAGGSVKIPAGVTQVTVTMLRPAAVCEEERDLTVSLEFALNRVDSLTSDGYTATSWQALTEATTEAEALIGGKTGTAATLQTALDQVNAALDGLYRLTDGTVLSNTVLTKSGCSVGGDTRLYQTFTTGEDAGKVAYIDLWAELRMDDDYAFDGITLSVYALNPNKYFPYRLGEQIGSSASAARGDGVEFRYRFSMNDVVLEPNTTYAVVLSRTFVEDSAASSDFSWMLTEQLEGEYLVSLNEDRKMSDVSHYGSGSFRIVFGTTETKTALNTAAAEALALDLTGYSADSAKRVTDAVSAIDVLLRKDSFTAEEQDSAISALNTAVSGLEKAFGTAAPDTSAPDTEPAVAIEKAGVPVWVWIVAGCAAAAVIAAVALVCARKKKQA